MRDFPNNFDEISDRYPQFQQNPEQYPQKAAKIAAQRVELSQTYRIRIPLAR